MNAKAKLRASVIIPTYNREKELTDCIQSILEQTEFPYELIVIDDADLKKAPLKEECKKAGIKYTFQKKKGRCGHPESKNQAIKISAGNILIFFDDDVVLFPDYIKETMNVYRGDKDFQIGGVCGAMQERRSVSVKSHIRRAFEAFFLISGSREGRVLPSGFCVEFGEASEAPTGILDVRFFPGCACSFRKEAIEDVAFTDQYRKFAFGEDKDFSIRIAKKHRLVMNTNAKLHHLESTSMRPDKGREGRMYIIGKYLFFKWHVKQSGLDWFFFYYAIFGYMFMQFISMVILPKKGKLERYGGALGAIMDT
ncbi:MAG: glycosyltransferase, partial [Thermodesulfobacteriota bacterium]